MPKWRNWSGKLESRPEGVHFVRSEADAAALAAAATSAGRKIRVAGATHSHAPLVVNDGGVIADVGGLSGVLETDVGLGRAVVWAGSRIFSLGNALNLRGLAFANQGDIDQQAIAGAVATGTHGTGATLRNFSAQVLGLRLVLANGDIVDASPDQNTELWQAARLHLGAFGIITRLTLAVRPRYRLSEQSWESTLEPVLADTDVHVRDNRHFEFFWYPQDDRAVVKTINETEDEAEYPLAEEGSRCAWSHEVLPNYRPVPHTEMEYSVPAEHGIACMREIRDLLRNRFPDVAWPVEYRTLAADDVWLSTAYERDTVTISVHLGMDEDDGPYFRACEEVFRSHDGRPHWGKVHYLDGATLARIHPRWADWWRVRDAHDPRGTFLNAYLASLRS
ncbi:MAG: D-arabinono-1,4-lactone oxidase [Pseudomonadales bacterium]